LEKDQIPPPLSFPDLQGAFVSFFFCTQCTLPLRMGGAVVPVPKRPFFFGFFPSLTLGMLHLSKEKLSCGQLSFVRGPVFSSSTLPQSERFYIRAWALVHAGPSFCPLFSADPSLCVHLSFPGTAFALFCPPIGRCPLSFHQLSFSSRPFFPMGCSPHDPAWAPSITLDPEIGDSFFPPGTPLPFFSPGPASGCVFSLRTHKRTPCCCSCCGQSPQGPPTPVFLAKSPLPQRGVFFSPFPPTSPRSSIRAVWAQDNGTNRGAFLAMSLFFSREGVFSFFFFSTPPNREIFLGAQM